MSLVARSTTEPSQVPYEMLEAVFSYLDVYDLLDAAHTCSRWKEVVNSSEVLWRRQLAKLGVQRSPDRVVPENLLSKVARLKAKAATAQHKKEVMDRWLSGQYSNFTYEDYCRSSSNNSEKGDSAPAHRQGQSLFMCKLNCEEWGRIMDAEMQGHA